MSDGTFTVLPRVFARGEDMPREWYSARPRANGLPAKMGRIEFGTRVIATLESQDGRIRLDVAHRDEPLFHVWDFSHVQIDFAPMVAFRRGVEVFATGPREEPKPLLSWPIVWPTVTKKSAEPIVDARTKP